MKPTIKLIVTSPDASLARRFVEVLSATDVTEHERKVPNPLSATKEEAVLNVQTGRTEWEDVAIQAFAVDAQKRYDFVWATLLKDLHGAIILFDPRSPDALDNVRRLTRLFNKLALSHCVIGVIAEPESEESKSALAKLNSPYPKVKCNPEDLDSVQHTVRAILDLILPNEEFPRKGAK